MLSRQVLRYTGAILILWLTIAGQARPDEPPPKPLTEEQKAKLKECERLAKEAQHLGAAGKLDEMVAVWEKKLAIERAVFGDVHEEVSRSLGTLGRIHEMRGDFDAARKARKEDLALQAKLHGDKDWRVTATKLDLEELEELARLDPAARKRFWQAGTLNKQADNLRRQGRYREAMPIARAAQAIVREVRGEGHPAYATSLNTVASLYQATGEYGKALRLFEKALEITRERLTENNPAYPQSLNNLALLYMDMGDYGRALPLLEQARDRYRNLLTENHPDYATSLNNLAALLKKMGDFSKALPLYEQARDLRKSLLGMHHPDYANSLNNLALLYRDIGDFEKALRLSERARDLTRESLGANHPVYAISLHNLAGLYHDLGDYSKALPLSEESHHLLKKLLTENHPAYATSLATLASLYQDLGDYNKAQLLFEQARNLRKRHLTENHPDYASSINDLAGLYLDMRDYSKALPLFEEARDLRERLLTENHPDRGASLNNLALLYVKIRDYGKALPLFEQARKLVPSENHPDYATSLNNLALVYQAMGDYSKALPLFKQACDLDKKLLTDNHPNHLESLRNLALTYQWSAQTDLAVSSARQALRTTRRFLDRTLATQSERQRLDFLRKSQKGLDIYLTSVVPLTAAATPKVYSDLLPWKAAASARHAEELLARNRPDLRPVGYQLRLAQAGLAHLAQITPATPAQREDWVKRFDGLEGEVERLERALAKESDAFRRFRDLREAGAADVAKALPADTALIDFVAYSHISAAPKTQPAFKVEDRLLAFVVRRGRDPVCVPLGRTDDIEKAALTWRADVLGGQNPNAAGARLAALVWQPLAKHLGDARTVLLAPDGRLAFVPFAALPGSKPGTYLVEEVTLGYVTSGRHLLELAADAADRPGSDGLLALGGLDYGPRPAGSMAVAIKDDPRGMERGHDVNPYLFLKSAFWKPLPGTRSEAENIVRVYSDRYRDGRAPLLLSGTDADTDRLRRELTPTKGTSRWRYLHLATHGYFQPPSLKPPGKRADDLIDFDRERGLRTTTRNPLLLSGLVLAGANRAPDRGTLSAQEASTLDLRGAELVVLSACDTGLGKVADGEGVLGLKRAFQMAGARTVVASLWKVNDAATSLLMEEFYANLWQKKLTKIEALRQAQLTVLKNPALVRQRDEELAKAVVRAPGDAEPLPPPGPAAVRSHPALWAAFVSYGDPGTEPEARK
jgi:CHAT domain-containing protein/tetratricopeptide (TPR) repeat protein